MAADSVVSIAWDVLKNAINRLSIKRQLGYLISSESYAQDLQKEVGKLAYQADWVDIGVEEAGNFFWNIKYGVTNWQGEAKEAMEEARDLLGDFEKASKTCCYGTLPDPNCCYQFSRMAMYKIEGIRRLAQEGNKLKKMDDISSSLTPKKFNLTSIELREDGVFESRDLITRDIMKALADNKTNVVGIYGTGGVGKSTLLVDVEWRIREEKSYAWVVKVDVSKNPDIKRIQGEIAYCLGFSNNINQVDVSRRAELLHRRLHYEEMKRRKVLIILDSLWEGLDLQSVGIPCRHDNKVIGCKLLLTSRNPCVLRSEMCCDRDFRLDSLKEEEAKRLFERIVGGKVHDDEFKPWVELALHKCAGEEEKSFLQLCVVYGGSEPSLENLVKRGADLGLFREVSSMEKAKESLRSLKASSLLSDNGDPDGFKIHDLVRQFVISVASKDHRLHVLNDKR